MGLIAMTCPNCGANLNIEEDRDTFFCSYCGARVEREKDTQDEAFLERAYVFLEDGDYGAAAVYFNRALDASPKRAEAYWGLFLCEAKVRSANELGPDNFPSELSDLEKAVRFSDGAIRSRCASRIPTWKRQAGDLLKCGKYWRAARCYRFLSELCPEDPEGYVGLFLSLAQSTTLEGALKEDSAFADPTPLQKADELTGGRYQETLRRLKEHHLSAIRSAEREVGEFEEAERAGKLKRPYPAPLFQECLGFLSLLFIISSAPLLGRLKVYIFVIFGLGLIGLIVCVLLFRSWFRRKALYDAFDRQKDLLKKLKQDYEAFYGNFTEREGD